MRFLIFAFVLVLLAAVVRADVPGELVVTQHKIDPVSYVKTADFVVTEHSPTPVQESPAPMISAPPQPVYYYPSYGATCSGAGCAGTTYGSYSACAGGSCSASRGVIRRGLFGRLRRW